MAGLVHVDLCGHQIGYLSQGAAAPTSEYLENFDVLEDRRLAHHLRMRRILVQALPTLPLTYYLLHWSNGIDLVLLDEHVIKGQKDGGSFRDALLGELRTVVCTQCGAVVRAVVADSGHPLFAADRERRLREHRYVETCPVCKGHLGPYVLEVID